MASVSTTTAKSPLHVAIILDGNGRWASSRGKARLRGHYAGWKRAKSTVLAAIRENIHTLTVYAFSRENWRRPTSEISYLMRLFSKALAEAQRHLQEHQIAVRIIGAKDKLPFALLHAIESLETNSQQLASVKLHLNLAIDYTGRWEIVEAVKKCAKRGLSEEQITEENFASFMEIQTPVDLLIRTGGEYRFSNFLLWQLSYAELYFSPVLWPDFDEAELHQALQWFYVGLS